MGLEEAVECVAGTKAKEASQLRLGKLPTLVFLQCERFERSARQIFAGSLEPFRHIVWNFDRYLHATNLAARTSRGQGNAIPVLLARQKPCSKIRLVRVRDLGVLVCVVFTPVFGADQLRPWIQGAPIRDGRGPRRREHALI